MDLNLDKFILRYEYWAEDESISENIRKEHRQIAEWLKELKQLREQTRWVPCSEKQPVESGKYWCTFGGTGLTGSDYYTTESDAKKLFDDPEIYDIGWQSENVVAWMPLPESYKAENEEG